MKTHSSKPRIFLNDWLRIHPYKVVQPSDAYFTSLANKLYKACKLDGPSESCRIRMCLYAAAYLEDKISGLGLWDSFSAEHERLYGTPIPFYPTDNDYRKDEINKQDIAFILWNTWQKTVQLPDYISPDRPDIENQAELFSSLLDAAYEEAPENESLSRYFDGFADAEEADRKLTWLFGHTYLTEPAMLPYIERVTPSDRFIVPTGPLALFLHEWIPMLTTSDQWKQIEGLCFSEPEVPEEIKHRNKETYENFTAGTGGKNIVYLNGYKELRGFLVDVLKWQDDDNHTLPQMKAYRDFVLMANPEKGILLAKDICECIAAPDNPLYNKEEAQKHAFLLLTEEMRCPPDLLAHCIGNGLIPDARFPGTENNGLVRRNADFIARHALLYYYRGD